MMKAESRTAACRRILRAFGMALIAVLLVGLFSGCNIIRLGEMMIAEERADEEWVLLSSNGKYQMTLPGDWSQAEDELNAQAILQASNPLLEKYVVVLAENRADFVEDATVLDYMGVLVDQMGEAMEDMTATPAEALTVGERTWYLSRIEGVVDGYRIAYWLTCVETDTDFVQITGWTLQSRADEYDEEMRRVAASFRDAE